MFATRTAPSALALLAIVTSISITPAYANDVDAKLHVDLKHIAKQRIFFGHQSVGMNILEGLKQLSAMAGVPVKILETKKASEVGPSTIGHTFIAKNGDPFLKLKSFGQALGIESAGLDVALMKFCYVDFTANTDVKALFARYRATIGDLKARNPGTTFVHVTAPLTTVQSGFKGTLKKLFGIAPYGAIENIRREEYNELLRKAYRGREPIFDLARVESTAPDGTAVTNKWKGSIAPAMDPEYTEDGGHLNAAGKLRAARELVSILASLPSRHRSAD